MSIAFLFFFLYFPYTKPVACMVFSSPSLFSAYFFFFVEEFCYNESYELPDDVGFRLQGCRSYIWVPISCNE